MIVYGICTQLQLESTAGCKLTCCSILPALAFSLDMFVKTDMSFGVNEVLLASVLGSIVFSVAAAQPLVIVGVTGMGSRLQNNKERLLTINQVP